MASRVWVLHATAGGTLVPCHAGTPPHPIPPLPVNPASHPCFSASTLLCSCHACRSCPDATGLGVDIARMLLDFGLRILRGDISTDGKWCFIIFKVCLSSGELRWACRQAGRQAGRQSTVLLGRQAGSAWLHLELQRRLPPPLASRLTTPSAPLYFHTPVPACLPAGVPPRWQLLKSRLDAICPSGTDTLQQLWRWRSVPKEQQPFLLQASPLCWHSRSLCRKHPNSACDQLLPCYCRSDVAPHAFPAPPDACLPPPCCPALVFRWAATTGRACCTPCRMRCGSLTPR